MRAPLALVALAALPLAGCLPEVDLAGRRCPCVEGWTCDTDHDLCVPRAGQSDDAGTSDACADGVRGMGRCYRLTEATVDFGDARELCRLWGDAEIVVLDDAGEEAWVARHVAGGAGYWIGLTAAATQGTRLTGDGSPPPYLHWDEGEPNGGDDSDCARVETDTGLWRDTPCSQEHQILCERSAAE